MTGRSVTIAAPAKINLFLRVLERRPDGFHELETLFQAISLADEVKVTLGEKRDDPQISLHVEGPDLGPIESNLAYRAARRFCEEAGVRAAIDVRLVKRIPAGAGLGGGSSDAAAVLRCLAELTDFREPAVLHGVAAELGSDVPFFLGESATALGRGRGEVLTPVPALPEAALVLALPPVHVSSAEAYRVLAASRLGSFDAGARGTTAPDDYSTLDWPRVIEELAHNDFGPVVAARHPEVRASLEGLAGTEAKLALLSGSGAAAFGIFGDATEAERAATTLEAKFGWPFVQARTLGHFPTPEYA